MTDGTEDVTLVMFDKVVDVTSREFLPADANQTKYKNEPKDSNRPRGNLKKSAPSKDRSFEQSYSHMRMYIQYQRLVCSI